jgi:hypothetical protein
MGTPFAVKGHSKRQAVSAMRNRRGADSALESTLIAAFEKGRNRIRSVCAEALDQNGGEGVVLHSGLFRVEGMEPDRGTAA